LRGEVDDVGAQPLGRRLEGDAGTRRVLEEEVDDRAATERRKLLDLAGLRRGHLGGRVEDVDGVRTGEVARVEEVPHARASPAVIVTASVPSISSTSTATRS